jgi:uncharacterized protein (TIGR04222 family)
MSLLNLPGPDFLVAYAVLLLLAVVAGWLLSRWLRHSPPFDAPPDLDLDPFELAYLSQGQRGLVQTALASLHQRELVMPGHGAGDLQLVRRESELPHLEQRVLDSLGAGLTAFTSIERSCQAECERMHERFVSAGLLLAEAPALLARLAPPLCVASVGALGAYKLVMGVGRGHPVGLLLLALGVTALLAYWVTPRSPIRSTAADSLLRQLRSGEAELKHRAGGSGTDLLQPAEVAMAAALFGIAALAAPQFIGLAHALTPPPPTSGAGVDGGGGCDGGCGGCGCGGCG